MLDWDGHIARRFSYQPGKANLFVLEPGGRVVWRAAGKPGEAQLRELLGVIEKLLKTNPQGTAG